MKQRQYGRYRGFLLQMMFFCAIIAGMIVMQSKVKAAADYKYLIKVNKQENCITIYEKDTNGEYTVPFKAMVCSTGYATPLGTFNTKIKYRWKVLLENVWGQYSTRITGSILFHSVWYYKQDPSTLSAKEYNKLGTTCSHGCIRLTVEDAKWIYDHCPIGTTVVIYNDKDPGPLGKPMASKLKAGTRWDPTDPDENNPLHQQEPETYLETTTIKPSETTIHGAKNQSIDWGSEFDPMKGVSAIDRNGENITSQLQVAGEVNTKVAGKYQLTYKVTDRNKKEVTCTITIKVRICPYQLVLQGVTDRVVSKTEKVNRKFCLQGVQAFFGETELNQKEIEVTIDEFNTMYCVTYQVTSETGETVSETAEFYIDATAPVIEANHMLYAMKRKVNREFVLKYIKVSDDYATISEDAIDIQIEEVFAKGYLITITASDDCGNTATKTVQFTRTDCVRIEGVENHTIPKGTQLDRDFCMQGITGKDGSKDATDKVKVTISEAVDHVYTVTYELSDKYGNYTKILAFFTEEAA